MINIHITILYYTKIRRFKPALNLRYKVQRYIYKSLLSEC